MRIPDGKKFVAQIFIGHPRFRIFNAIRLICEAEQRFNDTSLKLVICGEMYR